jgi:hypothetical protein
VLASKADNINKKYNAYFNKFISWCNLHNFPSLPADNVTVTFAKHFSFAQIFYLRFTCNFFNNDYGPTGLLSKRFAPS